MAIMVKELDLRLFEPELVDEMQKEPNDGDDDD